MPYVLLDSSLLSIISNPSYKEENRQCQQWVKGLVQNDIAVVIPAVTDYELRRTLLQGHKEEGLKNLDRIGSMGLMYVEMTEKMWRKGSELWAWARNSGQSTAHAERIDIDCLLASQAIVLAESTGEYTVVATKNIKHIQRYTPAMKWEDITIQHFQKASIGVAT